LTTRTAFFPLFVTQESLADDASDSHAANAANGRRAI
jgi:hypothetical protein